MYKIREIDQLSPQVVKQLSIFNTPSYFQLHSNSESLYLGIEADGGLLAVCQFQGSEDGIFKSPNRGTFGGLNWIIDPELTTQHQAVQSLIAFFQQKNATQLIITEPPFAHDFHRLSSQMNAYLANGLIIKNQEINHSLEVNQHPLQDRMQRNNQKRLRKCQRSAGIFEQVLNPLEFPEIYQIIVANRTHKGFFVSMSLEQILKMQQTFPQQVYFFKTCLAEKIVAASICIKINSEILYVFYWGDLPGYEQYSPVAHLANGIYEFAQKNNFKILDVGTSSLNGLPNFGVANFKESLGFRASPKITFQYNYER